MIGVDTDNDDDNYTDVDDDDECIDFFDTCSIHTFTYICLSSYSHHIVCAIVCRRAHCQRACRRQKAEIQGWVRG